MDMSMQHWWLSCSTANTRESNSMVKASVRLGQIEDYLVFSQTDYVHTTYKTKRNMKGKVIYFIWLVTVPMNHDKRNQLYVGNIGNIVIYDNIDELWPTDW